MTSFIKYSIRNVVVGFLSVILLLSGVSENAFFNEKTQASFCLEQRAKKRDKQLESSQSSINSSDLEGSLLVFFTFLINFRYRRNRSTQTTNF